MRKTNGAGVNWLKEMYSKDKAWEYTTLWSYIHTATLINGPVPRSRIAFLASLAQGAVARQLWPRHGAWHVLGSGTTLSSAVPGNAFGFPFPVEPSPSHKAGADFKK